MDYDPQEKYLLPDGSVVATGLQLPSAEELALCRSEFQVYGSDFYLDKKDIETSLRNDRYKDFRKLRSPWIMNQGSLGSCFPPNTQVRLANGSNKPIQEMNVLDEVVSAEGNARKVVRVIARPFIGELVNLRVWGHRHLSCTPEHPILTKEGYKSAKDLQREDWVAFPKYTNGSRKYIETKDYIFRRSTQYTEKQILHTPRLEQKCIPGKAKSFAHTVAVPEVIELDRDFGWVVGLFVSDGCASSAKVVFCLGLHEEATLGKKLHEILLAKFGVKTTGVRRQGMYQVKLYGVNWAELFLTLGGIHSNKKNLHSDLCEGSLEFLEGILEGWTDGDGLGSQKLNIGGGVTVSPKLAMQMFDIANATNRSPTIETLIVAINPKHKIKHRHKRYVVKWRQEKKAESWSCKDEASVMWRKIDTLDTSPYDGWVFNLEVEVDNSYVAESIGVHNCNANATVNAFHNRRDLDGYAHVALSANWLYMHINGGRDNGSQLRDGFKFSQTGIAPRQLKRDGEDYLFPDTVFRKDQVSQKWLKVANEEAGTYVAYEPYLLPVDNFETFKIALASAIARDHQVIHAWHVGNGGMRLRNGYAVIGRGPGNHATLFHSGKWVGGSDLVHPDSENSWGPSKNSLYGRVGGSGWGDDGFGLFTMADAYAAHEYHAYWVLVGTKVTDGALNAK